MMIRMADKKDKNGVDPEDFMNLMRELGLVEKSKISEVTEQHKLDY